ncbi:hypothetical protein JB92DRAFT_2874840 [Gautieria morchelliformis]|nr:hypothetical protein JB92DRAFT_2874840 [Gautieria morchelliformis]
MHEPPHAPRNPSSHAPPTRPLHRPTSPLHIPRTSNAPHGPTLMLTCPLTLELALPSQMPWMHSRTTRLQA